MQEKLIRIAFYYLIGFLWFILGFWFMAVLTGGLGDGPERYPQLRFLPYLVLAPMYLTSYLADPFVRIFNLTGPAQDGIQKFLLFSCFALAAYSIQRICQFLIKKQPTKSRK